MKKRKNLESVVGETTHAAQDLGKDALAQASAYVQQAQDYLTPLAKDAKKKGAKFAADAVDAVQPKLDEALSKVSPAIDDAYARIVPAVESARDKVQHDLIPAVSDMLHSAAEDLAKVELPATKAPKKKSCWRTFGKLLLATGLLAVIIMAIRKFLAPNDSGWQAHEPSSPYVPTSTQNLVDDLAKKGDQAKDAASEWIDDAGNDDARDALKKVADSEEPTDDAPEVAEGDASPFGDSPYGEGSYVGTEPPEGFSIKGNERSMKFHVPSNGGYERTIADVWFTSEEAAVAAGFAKAKR